MMRSEMPLHVAALLTALVLLGCTASPDEVRNARFRMADLDQAVAGARASLLGSDFVRSARPGQGVSVRSQPLRNLSLDRFTEAEERLVTSRLLSDSDVQRALRGSGIAVLDPDLTRPSDATHRLEPEIRSIARDGSVAGRERDARSDAYLLEYRVIERATGSIVWQHTAEIARAAGGLVID